MNNNWVVSEKLVMGACFLLVALGIAIAVPLVVDPSIRRMLFQAALIVLVLSLGSALLGGLDWLVAPRKSDHPIDELFKLGELRDRGILTEEEFQAQKRKLLDQS